MLSLSPAAPRVKLARQISLSIDPETGNLNATINFVKMGVMAKALLILLPALVFRNDARSFELWLYHRIVTCNRLIKLSGGHGGALQYSLPAATLL